MIKIIDIYIEGTSEETQAKAKGIATKIKHELYADLIDGAKINLYLEPKAEPMKTSIHFKINN